MKWLLNQSPNRWTIAAYCCISVALLSVILLGIWGAYRDATWVRSITLQAEIARLRAEAIRTVGRIERLVDQAAAEEGIVDRTQLLEQQWLTDYWQSVNLEDPRLYAAVVDDRGVVIQHSNPELAGRRLGRRWYERVASTNGADVFETRSEALTGGERAYDIRVPITREGREIGEYHAGFDLDWFNGWVAEKRSEILGRWTFIVGGILLVVFLAAMSLYYLAIRSLALGQAAQHAELQRKTEVGQLAAGLAHEICNPLHAIRLNLHALGRAHNGSAQFDREELTAITRESNEEIDRVDRLLRELVGFASPEKARDETLDAAAEMQATLDFVRQEMQQKQIRVHTDFPEQPLMVFLDRSRLRQVLLNLLVNAKEAVDEGGAIEVAVARRGEGVEIMIGDDGPGILQRDCQRIFEPFYTTKEHGSGLGLSLVQRFVDEAGGSVDCENAPGQGARFTVLLPLAPRAKIQNPKKALYS